MLGKILLTIIVVALIFFGFKYLGRMAELRDRPRPPSRPGAKPEAEPEAETMVECRVCRTWQPQRGAKSCGRSDCPF
jgi:hypothetical protein